MIVPVCETKRFLIKSKYVSMPELFEHVTLLSLIGSVVGKTEVQQKVKKKWKKIHLCRKAWQPLRCLTYCLIKSLTTHPASLFRMSSYLLTGRIRSKSSYLLTGRIRLRPYTIPFLTSLSFFPLVLSPSLPQSFPHLTFSSSLFSHP